jgi:thiol-disulfide isomerase/thioredoxin
LQPAELLQGDVIVIVWASWSPRCRDIVERSNEVVDRWGDQARVLTVVFQEDRETVERFLIGKSPRAPVFLDRDGAFSKRHTVTHLPGLLIFKDGDTEFSGRFPMNPHSLIEQTLG